MDGAEGAVKEIVRKGAGSAYITNRLLKNPGWSRATGRFAPVAVLPRRDKERGGRRCLSIFDDE